MKKLILLFLLLPFLAHGQQTYWPTGIKPGSTSFTPTFRSYTGSTDSLNGFTIGNGTKNYIVYTAAQSNARFLQSSGSLGTNNYCAFYNNTTGKYYFSTFFGFDGSQFTLGKPLFYNATVPYTAHAIRLVYTAGGQINKDSTYQYTKIQTDSAITAHVGLIPTNGLQPISPDSVGLGGSLTQTTNIDALGYGMNILAENGDNSTRFTLLNGLSLGISNNGADNYFYGTQSDPTQSPGAAIGYQNGSSNQSFININKHSMSVYDTLHRIGLVDSLHQNVVSGLQLAEIGTVDSIANVKIDSAFTGGGAGSGALINGATNTLTAPTIFDAGSTGYFEALSGPAPYQTSFIISPNATALTDAVSSTVSYGTSLVTSGVYKGANFGFTNLGAPTDKSIIQIDENHMYIKDTHNNMGLIDTVHHTVTSQLQLAEIQDIHDISDSTSLAIYDSSQENNIADTSSFTVATYNTTTHKFSSMYNSFLSYDSSLHEYDAGLHPWNFSNKITAQSVTATQGINAPTNDSHINNLHIINGLYINDSGDFGVTGDDHVLTTIAGDSVVHKSKISEIITDLSLINRRALDSLAIVKSDSIFKALDYYNVLNYGAKRDSTVDLSIALDSIQNAITAGTIYIPAGKYKMLHGFHMTKSIRILGDGRMDGNELEKNNGAGFVPNNGATKIYYSGTDSAAFKLNYVGCSIEQIGVIYAGANGTGFRAFTAAQAGHFIIVNNSTTSFGYGLKVDSGSYEYTVHNNIFDDVRNVGNYVDNTTQPDRGDQSISGNTYLAHDSTAVAALYIAGGGGVRFTDNKIIWGKKTTTGFQYGEYIHNIHAATSILISANNSIEAFTKGGIYQPTGTYAYQTIKSNGDEFQPIRICNIIDLEGTSIAGSITNASLTPTVTYTGSIYAIKLGANISRFAVGNNAYSGNLPLANRFLDGGTNNRNSDNPPLLTAGTGISGPAYNGVTAQTWVFDQNGAYTFTNSQAFSAGLTTGTSITSTATTGSINVGSSTNVFGTVFANTYRTQGSTTVLNFMQGTSNVGRFSATNGNFLINSTTDDGVNKLQVNGSAKISGVLNATTVSYLPTYQNTTASTPLLDTVLLKEGGKMVGAKLSALAASLIQGTPTIAAGAGAGTSPTISVTSNGRGLQVTLTVGTLPTGANATVATVTLANALAYTPYPVASNANATASLLSGATMVYFTSTGTTNVTITSGTTALPAGTYIWNIAL